MVEPKVEKKWRKTFLKQKENKSGDVGDLRSLHRRSIFSIIRSSNFSTDLLRQHHWIGDDTLGITVSRTQEEA